VYLVGPYYAKLFPLFLQCIVPRDTHSFIRQLFKARAGQTVGLHVKVLNY